MRFDRGKRRFAWLLLLAASAPRADEADVVEACASPTADGRCHFEVTVRHGDEGQEIPAPDGDLLGRRTLYHPRVDEQPFRHALFAVAIPADLGEVRIRAHDSRHGYRGRELLIPLPQ